VTDTSAVPVDLEAVRRDDRYAAMVEDAAIAYASSRGVRCFEPLHDTGAEQRKRDAYRATVRRHLDAAGVPKLLAEVERLTKLTATCVCYDGNPANYEGPQVDCPVHGAVRAFNEATREIERLRPIVEAAREFGTLVLRGSWSEEQAAEFIAATQARGDVR
jgi:hypothetical protein